MNQNWIFDLLTSCQVIHKYQATFINPNNLLVTWGQFSKIQKYVERHVLPGPTGADIIYNVSKTFRKLQVKKPQPIRRRWEVQ